MKTATSLASAGGLFLLLTHKRSSAVPCNPSALSSPFVVQDTAGALQLAEAINCSSGTFDVDWVGSVTVKETIRVSNGTALFVVGTADGSSLVDGAGDTVLFEVSGGTLSLSGLSVNNGAGSDGGAIYATDSVLTVEKCTFSDNYAGDDGGAVYLYNSTLEATESTFASNFANDSAGAMFAFSSALTLKRSTFADNYANGDGGAVHLYNATLEATGSISTSNSAKEKGGAIDAREGSMLTLDGCFFSNNYADHAGAMFLGSSILGATGTRFSSNFANQTGGAIATFSAISAIDSCVFSDNHAGGGGGCFSVWQSVLTAGSCAFSGNSAATGGGGISAAVSEVTIDNCTFSDNRVEGSGGGGGAGGGVYAQACTKFRIEDSWFLSNFASLTGGAVSLLYVGADGLEIADEPAVIPGCSFAQNSAGDAGGGVFIAAGFVQISGSDFNNNTAGACNTRLDSDTRPGSFHVPRDIGLHHVVVIRT